jgi:GT2 family glycosyltransferase
MAEAPAQRALAPRATVVVVPREGFGTTLRCLDTLFAATGAGFRLVVVDGGSPRALARRLRALAAERGFQLIRTEHYLSPNQARNLGLAAVHTEWSAFLDNNVLVAPGWLDALLRCADETGASAVVPLTTYGDLEGEVHFAGGKLTIVEENGKRVLYDVLEGSGMSLPEVRAWVKRAPSDFVEFHAFAVRTQAARAVGGFDEHLLCTREHMDFSRCLTQAGGRIFVEPDSTVAVLLPDEVLDWSDIPYYLLRWSETWIESSEQRLFEKWGAGIHVAQLEMLRAARRKAYRRPLRALRKVVGPRMAERFAERALYPLESAASRLGVRLLWHHRPK